MAWLRDNSAWVPLKVMIKSKPEELIEAGYPEGPLRAFLDAYRELEQAESSSPGRVSDAAAAKFLTAARELGEAVNPTKYPTVPMIERETHFNAMNPFWQAPYAYGAATLLLLLCMGIVVPSGPSSFASLLKSTLYRIGLSSLAIGIALEIYGFYLRVGITGWAPVTNMYETVIWVALVAAVLSFVFEMIYRRVFPAMAGSAFALLGTLTAANVALSIPVSRVFSRCWQQSLADDPCPDRGVELRGVRAGLDARPGGDAVLPDGHLSPLAQHCRAGIAPGAWRDPLDRRKSHRRRFSGITRPGVDTWKFRGQLKRDGGGLGGLWPALRAGRVMALAGVAVSRGDTARARRRGI